MLSSPFRPCRNETGKTETRNPGVKSDGLIGAAGAGCRGVAGRRATRVAAGWGPRRRRQAAPGPLQVASRTQPVLLLRPRPGQRPEILGVIGTNCVPAGWNPVPTNPELRPDGSGFCRRPALSLIAFPGPWLRSRRHRRGSARGRTTWPTPPDRKASQTSLSAR